MTLCRFSICICSMSDNSKPALEFFREFRVVPAPQVMAAVARALGSLFDYVWGDTLQVVCLANLEMY